MAVNNNSNKIMNPSKIIGIQFSILSPDDIRKASVAEIYSRDTYVNNKPEIGGLFDPRMGVLEPGLICPTDGLNYMDTPGYFGHIELARPVFYIQYMTHIMKILRCVCFKCSKLLIDKHKYKQSLNMDSKQRWDFVFSKASKVQRCGDENENGCGCKQPSKFSKEGLATINAEWKKLGEDEDELSNVSIKVTPEMVIKIFSRISDDDVTFMGFSPVFSRPDWMICQVLAVPPPAVRPSVKHDAQQRSEDDISHIIVNIIKANKTLQEKIEQNAKENVIEDWSTVLQYYVATMVNNKIPGTAPVAQRSGRPLKSISERLNGKTGRVRGNLMGKRVDFSARSVITADPNLSIRQLGVPKKVAMNITYPDTVNNRNKNTLLKFVRNGPSVYPGAKMLERSTGENISLMYVDRESIVLNDGDIVHRHMIDGDAVLFNRQPTLHRMSMMCHIAKIMEQGNTFRLNVADTKPYNADFDGDEMNMHMPQNEESSCELRNLAAVPRQIISPANNASIVGIFQDSLLGAFRITRPDVEFDKRHAMNLMSMYPKLNTGMFHLDQDKISVFQILSQILPPLTTKYKNNSFDDEIDTKDTNNIVEITNGVMKRGQLDKGVKRLLHSIFNDFGFNASADFIDNLQNIVTQYMRLSGFSVGISDLIADKETNTKIADTITNKKTEVQNLIDQVQIGIFENNTGNSNYTEFETCVNSILNKAQEEAGKLGRKSLDKDNRFKIMVQAGSKGSDLNIAQMISCLGQQNVDGKRIPYGYEDRTLPHFNKYDDSPEARGFVESSFIQGLTPEEMFFHAMGGRTGLIDTAIKTSSSGYIQRRLIKGLEDLKIEYDMTVRNNMGKIVQFEYGDDGIDSTKVEGQHLPFIDMTMEEIFAHYHMPDDVTTDAVFTTNYTHDALKRIKSQKEELNTKVSNYVDNIFDKKNLIVEKVFNFNSENKVNVPVNFARIIENIKNQLHMSSNSLVDITPLECFNMIEQCKLELFSIGNIKRNTLFETLFDFYMSPKELLMKHRFNEKSLKVLLKNIVINYKKALVSPGEMVGMIAAQSIGEPTTQLTLNSFTYETPIIIRRNGICKSIKLGDFVEQLITYGKTGLTKMEYYDTNDTTYAPTLNTDNYEIQSHDEDGNVSWYKIIAGTQHPVINEDGTDTMVKVTTEYNQEIYATKAKSFLVLKDGKLKETRGDEIHVGDYLPVSMKKIDHNEDFELKVEQYLSPKEYMFGSHAKRAMELHNEYQWFKRYNNIEFILPYKRSDSFINRMKSLRKGCNNRVIIEDGFIYPKKTWKQSCIIPEKINMDFDFGYLLGAYCAEGCVTNTQISISNNNKTYLEPIERWCKKFNITTKYYSTTDKNENGWTSSDIRIYSVVLRDLIVKLCGKLSHNKFISSKLQFSNDEFKKGFINSYFGGDGTIRIKDKSIVSTSTSKRMLENLNVMLKTLGIMSFIHKHTTVISNNRNTKKENIHQAWCITVRNESMIKLAVILRSCLIKEKALLAEKLSNYVPKTKHMRHQMKIPNIVDGIINFEERDGRMKDTIFVKIKDIEEVQNTTNYAYDLTVDTTKNFILENGVGVRDTFHFAGVASKSNATRGVPRIEEILNLSKQPKNTSVTVELKKEHFTEKSKAQQFKHMIEHVSLRDVVLTSSICFDPDNMNTLIEEDKELMSQYNAFQNMFEECNETSNDEDGKPNTSKWLIRFEFDREAMLERNITMDDIHFAIKNGYKDEVECVFSDYNADKLVLRIRLMETYIKKASAGKTKDTLINNKQKSLDQSDAIYMLHNIQDNILDNIILKGIKHIKNVNLRKIQNRLIKENGNFVKKDGWVLDTAGTNLIDVLAMDEIDQLRTTSNDIIEIKNVFGIEAARQSIYNEMFEVLEHGSTYVNYHHLSMLSDRMCSNHKMVSIFRHGINNDDIGPIAKASFEETPEMFLRAARHGEMDNMRGVSANVMCGQEGNYGTSSFQVVLNIPEMVKLSSKTLEQERNIDSMFNMSDPDDFCAIENIKQTNNISTLKPNNIKDDDEYMPDF